MFTQTLCEQGLSPPVPSKKEMKTNKLSTHGDDVKKKCSPLALGALYVVDGNYCSAAVSEKGHCASDYNFMKESSTSSALQQSPSPVLLW